MAPHITVVSSTSHLDTLLSNASQISIIDFHASWCGPCHMIAPHFERLSTQFRQVQFLKVRLCLPSRSASALKRWRVQVDVDAQQLIAQRFAVSAMPTFAVCRGSQKIDEVRRRPQMSVGQIC